MNVINDGLSEPLYRAILRWQQSYKRTGYLSTTSCLKPPRMRILEERHEQEITVMASSLLPAFIGGACHNLIDGADPEAIHEEEFVTEVCGVKFSGRPDIIRSGTLLEEGDFKFTSVASYIYSKGEAKPEHVWQANINSWLAGKEGYHIERAWVELIFVDWKLAESFYDKAYPPRVVRLYPDLLPNEEIEEFVTRRVQAHLDAEQCPDDELPFCTPEEQWAEEDTWAVKKEGSSRAIRGGVCKTEKEAKLLLKKNGPGYYIEPRRGKRRRCANYCDAARFCNQHTKELVGEV